MVGNNGTTMPTVPSATERTPMVIKNHLRSVCVFTRNATTFRPISELEACAQKCLRGYTGKREEVNHVKLNERA